MNLRQLQLTQKAMLNTTINVCELLNTTWFLASGSLLGAVRHKGFIPWDDDIDIIMPRPDYDKFVERAQALLPSYYYLQTHHTDPEYLCSFAKIRDSRTTFVEKSLMLKNINHGVYIDIFPLDGFPEGAAKRFFFLLKYKLFSLRLSRENYARKRSLKWKIASTVAVVLCPSVEKAWKKRDILLRSVPYENAKMVSNLGNAWGSKEVIEKTVFQTSIDGEFEGMKVPIPSGYDKYLRKLYGEYMIFPPQEKRVPHHYHLLMDLEKSYLENLERINCLAKKECGW